jgi:hypothetical protein
MLLLLLLLLCGHSHPREGLFGHVHGETTGRM